MFDIVQLLIVAAYFYILGYAVANSKKG